MTKDNVDALIEEVSREVRIRQTIHREIAHERNRQVVKEGFSAEHDDAHTGGELAQAAACYALVDTIKAGWRCIWRGKEIILPLQWPNTWSSKWWKPEDRRRNLIKAAALLIAEIERLDRGSGKNDESHTQAPSIGGDSPGPHSRGSFFS